MYAWYLKLAISCASLMFIAGFISLLVLSVTKVSPARKGLNFEEVNCRVTDSEISCESGNCTCIRDTNTAQTPCLKVYVSCGGGVEAIGNRSFSASKQEGYLLRRDVHHLNDEVINQIIKLLLSCVNLTLLSSIYIIYFRSSNLRVSNKNYLEVTFQEYRPQILANGLFVSLFHPCDVLQ